ncbi:hypothetical protein J5N97_000229 [Dioscorea zingiberensis]|uniref:WRKY domain-containing protein n=1 Tax=Dioscorea zingiberensis TaxID=325984 RepID=A0A9D5BSQ8_9LILI|nr:hypothetical protein J5N97_000229 [Dioscorea zingiberensis]
MMAYSPFFLSSEDQEPPRTSYYEPFTNNTFTGGHGMLSFPADISETSISSALKSSINRTCGNDMKRVKVNNGTLRIGFRTKSQIEILDDGFKWRKYGKKSVKNSPNPRNYYRCSSEGCGVKKRVERDPMDSQYVITVYEGVHNHESPSGVQASSSSSWPNSWM